MNIKFSLFLVALNLLAWLYLIDQEKADFENTYTHESHCDPALRTSDAGNSLSLKDEVGMHERQVTNIGKQLMPERSAPARGGSNFNPDSDSTDVPDHFLPEDISIQANQNKAYKMEGFDFEAKDDKVSIVNSLANNGRDLEFLNNLLVTEQESPELKLAVIQKIRGSSSFAAKHALIQALDDTSELVSENALLALIESGDDSVIPMLESRRDALPEGALKQAFTDEIGRMENRIVVEMDSR